MLGAVRISKTARYEARQFVPPEQPKSDADTVAIGVERSGYWARCAEKFDPTPRNTRR